MDVEPRRQEGELEEGAAPGARVADQNYGILWEPGQCWLCGASFQKAGALPKHHTAVHCEIPLRFECGMCSRVFPGSHAALCHYSKCGGARVEELPHICEQCNRGYRTGSGLSQHKRHMHPEVREQERMLVLSPRRPFGRGRSVWSEEEEELVVEFGANHEFFGVYAPLIAARLPGKSSKQIREKVRTMRRLPHGAFEEEAVREEELIDAPPSSPSEAFGGPARSSGDESEASAERDAAVLEFNEW